MTGSYYRDVLLPKLPRMSLTVVSSVFVIQRFNVGFNGRKKSYIRAMPYKAQKIPYKSNWKEDKNEVKVWSVV